jgi:hypothetical protein
MFVTHQCPKYYGKMLLCGRAFTGDALKTITKSKMNEVLEIMCFHTGSTADAYKSARTSNLRKHDDIYKLVAQRLKEACTCNFDTGTE